MLFDFIIATCTCMAPNFLMRGLGGLHVGLWCMYNAIFTPIFHKSDFHISGTQLMHAEAMMFKNYSWKIGT